MSSRNKQQPSGRRAPKEVNILLSPAKVASLRNIKIDGVLSKILSDSGLKIRVEIGASGNSLVTLVDAATNVESATYADIERIAGFRRFVNEEKKQSLLAEGLRPIEDRLYNVTKVLQDDDPEKKFTPGKLSTTNIAALKESNLAVGNLLTSKKNLLEFADVVKDDIKLFNSMLLNWVNLSLEANTLLVAQLLRGGDPKDFIKENLFTLGVPIWVYNKITKSAIGESSDGDFRRVVFPADVKKGITLTVREITNAKFRKNNEFLLKYSKVQVNLMSNQEFLRFLFGLKEDISFTKESDAIGVKLRGEKVLLTPHWQGFDYFVEPHVKGKMSSFSQTPEFSTPEKSLRSITEALVQAQVFETRVGSQVANLWEPLARDLGIDFKTNLSLKRNLWAIALENKHLLEDRMYSVFTASSNEARGLLRGWIAVALRLPQKSVLLAEIVKALYLYDMELSVEEDKEIPNDFDHPDEFDDSAVVEYLGAEFKQPIAATKRWDAASKKISSDEDKLARDKISGLTGLKALLGVKEKKGKRGDVRLALLTRKSKSLLARLDEGQKFLEKPLGEWLKTFRSDALQNAAASLVEAQLDDILMDVESDEEEEVEEFPLD